MNNKVAIILINYKDYAKKYLDECLDSIRKQDYSGEFFVYIVDNETSDETYSYLKEKAPEAKIIRNEKNDGFAKGNNDAIKQAFKDECNYFYLLNMDTVSDKSSLSEMLKTIKSDEKFGAVQARLMLYSETSKINSLGNNTHFLGFGFCNAYNEIYRPEKVVDKTKMFYPSGAAVMFRREVLEKTGLFDEDYFMYNEDQDLGWRVWLAGYQCVLSKNAVVYHKYEFGRSISKYYFMDKNRIITALKNYKIITLILFFPAFLIMELGLFYFAIKNNWYKEKIKIWLSFFTLSFWKKIIIKRREVKKIRKIKDRNIINLVSGKIWYQEVSSPLLSVANIFLNIYFVFVKFLLKLFNV